MSIDIQYIHEIHQTLSGLSLEIGFRVVVRDDFWINLEKIYDLIISVLFYGKSVRRFIKGSAAVSHKILQNLQRLEKCQTNPNLPLERYPVHRAIVQGPRVQRAG
jgi:hypothetical protein